MEQGTDMLKIVCVAAAAILLASCGDAPTEDPIDPPAQFVEASQPVPVAQPTAAPVAEGDGFSSDEEVDPNYEESEPDSGEPAEESFSEVQDPDAPQEESGGW
jgi:hypothetical protein